MKKNFLALSGLTLALCLSACGEKKSSKGFGNPNQGPNQPAPGPQGGPGGQGPQGGGQGGPGGGINQGPTPNQGGPGGPVVNNGPIEPIQNGGGSVGEDGPRPGGNLPPIRNGGGRNSGGRGGVPVAEPDIQPPVAGGSSSGSLPARRPPQGSVRPATNEDNLAPWYAPEVKGSPAESWLYHVVNPLLKTLDNASPAPRVLKKRVALTIALGYMDGSADVDFKYNGRNYGRHAAVDPFLRAAVDQVLTSPCRKPRSQQLCDFDVISTNDVETFYRRDGAGGIVQEIRVLSGAISTEHDDNVGRDAQEQLRRSERAEQSFMKAFEGSEAVIYIGHSRQGGGPDFRPPRLKRNQLVDYDSYAKDRPGAKRTLTAVKGKNRLARSLAILSCDSTDFFMGEIAKAGPDMELVTLRGELKAEDLLSAGLVSAELFLRQGSLQGVNQFAAGSKLLSKALTLRLPTRTQR